MSWSKTSDDNKDNGDIKSIAEIDKLIHEPARLSIIAHLYVVESADMVFLKNQTELTWGNLSSHITKLEEAGYIIVEKRFKGKKPQTLLQLSKQGRKSFEDYRRKMSKVLGVIS
ncbi:MAG: winged helix-turn-helix domain-containing protein [Candidatus Thorarchaeota archaeon]